MVEFGRSMLSEWFLDPAFSYLNHGTVGATPRRVLDRQREVVEQIERHPADFMLRRLANPFAEDRDGDPPLMRQAAAVVADFVGADAAGTALVDNITTGASAVLGSLDIKPGDVLAVTNHGYGGVTNAVHRVAELAQATVQVIQLPSAGADRRAFTDAFTDQLEPGTRLVVIDHITSFSALVLPIADMVQACRSNGIPVFVDGAHVPAQLELDVPALGADWYSANLHKWAWTPRSTGFLWVEPQHREAIHAPVVSWGLGRGLAAEFDTPGTRDPSAFLAVPEALAFRAELGEQAIRDYNHNLVRSAAVHLSGSWGTPFTTPEAMTGSMVVVRLPERLGSTSEDAERVRHSLAANSHIEVPVFSAETESGAAATPDGLAIRVSTQIYNDHSDIERLEQAVNDLPDVSAETRDRQ